jgi:hypothetical protein
MRWKGVKLFVIAAAFLMLYGWKPAVDAQSPNCRCYGTIQTGYHPYIALNPVCGSHDFDNWWSFQGSAPACKSWCEAVIDFPTQVYCHDDFGLGLCGEAYMGPYYPTSFRYDADYYFYGPPYAQTGDVIKAWTDCDI